MLYSHLLVFIVLRYVYTVAAAFTLPTAYGTNTVQQNANKTWCYYPAAGQTRDVGCSGDFTMVSLVHLNTTISIGYYAPDNTRYGGAEWSVPLVNPGKVTLCVSGRAQDGTYQTACMFVSADNSLPIAGGCWIAIAQNVVTDGCYVPGQAAYTVSSLSPSTALHPTSTVVNTLPSTSTSRRIGTPYTIASICYAYAIVFILRTGRVFLVLHCSRPRALESNQSNLLICLRTR
jgi:hypothetical protein